MPICRRLAVVARRRRDARFGLAGGVLAAALVLAVGCGSQSDSHSSPADRALADPWNYGSTPVAPDKARGDDPNGKGQSQTGDRRDGVAQKPDRASQKTDGQTGNANPGDRPPTEGSPLDRPTLKQDLDHVFNP